MKRILLSVHHDDHGSPADQHATYGPGIRGEYHHFWPLLASGVLPIIMAGGRLSEEQVEQYVSLVDKVIIMGGDDVDPSWYGESVQFPNVQRYIDRDFNERLLIQEAIRQQKPLLGICRGLQIINVVLGGSLYQNINEQYSRAINHMQHKSDIYHLAHEISLEGDSLLCDARGPIDSIMVNSFHNQAIKDLAPALRVVARSNVIEAIQHESLPIYGVQRHPERSWFFDDASKQLLNSWIM